MKALVCAAFGPIEDLRVQDVAPPALGEDGVRIRVEACGINFPDILLVQGKYQVRPPLPFFPGGEVAGTISEVGTAVTGLKAGQRVMATIFWGGLAEEVVAPAKAIVPVPDEMDMLCAAVFQGGHTTSYHALRQRGALKPGEILLVLGAGGGVGMAAMQIGRAMGARVIGAVGSARKAEALKAEGFEELIDYGREDLREAVRSLTGGAGVDVVFDPVGGELFGQACRVARRNGRILIVGFASGQIGQYATNLALLKENAVIGVNYQQFFAQERAEVERNFAELMALHAQGRISPRIDRVFTLDEAVAALAAVADRSVVGKVVVALGG
ncbi:MAG: NADPH:quinone oxidoreductase family protein [Gammaproteobacteria bacterium]|nr:MAG: NADPH:quinone oxidoreductase family protein [Gammaproteobacteria bacterium]